LFPHKSLKIIIQEADKTKNTKNDPELPKNLKVYRRNSPHLNETLPWFAIDIGCGI
jgi:hypothetical protein